MPFQSEIMSHTPSSPWPQMHQIATHCPSNPPPQRGPGEIRYPTQQRPAHTPAPLIAPCPRSQRALRRRGPRLSDEQTAEMCRWVTPVLGRALVVEVAKAVGGGCCRLHMPLSLAPAVRGTVAGRRLGALDGGEVPSPHSNTSLPPPLLSLSQRSVVPRSNGPQTHGASHCLGTVHSCTGLLWRGPATLPPAAHFDALGPGAPGRGWGPGGASCPPILVLPQVGGTPASRPPPRSWPRRSLCLES